MKCIQSKIAIYDGEYGKNNHISNWLRLSLLFNELKIFFEGKCTDIPKSLELKIKEMSELSGLEYNRDLVRLKSLDQGTTIFQYPMEAYIRRYSQEEVQMFLDKLVPIHRIPEYSGPQPSKYPYVIDEYYNLSVYSDSISLSRFLKGKTDGDGYPVHPMLAIGSNLRVIAAGELVVFRQSDSKYRLYIDNLSGHYKPTYSDNSTFASIVNKSFRLQNLEIERAIYFTKSKGFSFCL